MRHRRWCEREIRASASPRPDKHVELRGVAGSGQRFGFYVESNVVRARLLSQQVCKTRPGSWTHNSCSRNDLILYLEADPRSVSPGAERAGYRQVRRGHKDRVEAFLKVTDGRATCTLDEFGGHGGDLEPGRHVVRRS